MGLMTGEPLVWKVAMVAKYVVFPGAMIAALIYSPPDYALSKKPHNQSSPSSPSK